MNGALENSFNRTSSLKFTLQSKGIREHAYEILEGGKEAFEKEKESIILKCFCIPLLTSVIIEIIRASCIICTNPSLLAIVRDF